MSDPLRIALVAEGWTDRSVVDAAITNLLGERSYDLNLLQPEDPSATPPFGVPRPYGWSGVYRWCREAVDRSNHLGADVLLTAYDLVILHLDADVADSSYRRAHILNPPNPDDLPCSSQICPPPNSTTDPLRIVLLQWAGENHTPERVVLCTPSKSTEAWVLAALYPLDASVVGGNLECIKSPANRLQAMPENGRMVRSGKKIREEYEIREQEISASWPQVRDFCSEAERFSIEFLAAVPV